MGKNVGTDDGDIWYLDEKAGVRDEKIIIMN